MFLMRLYVIHSYKIFKRISILIISYIKFRTEIYTFIYIKKRKIILAILNVSDFKLKILNFNDCNG